MYGFPAALDAKLIALRVTPRSLSNILGNRRPMRHPSKNDIVLGQMFENIDNAAHDKHLLVDRTV
jgi:hypothetical protein